MHPSEQPSDCKSAIYGEIFDYGLACYLVNSFSCDLSNFYFIYFFIEFSLN